MRGFLPNQHGAFERSALSKQLNWHQVSIKSSFLTSVIGPERSVGGAQLPDEKVSLASYMQLMRASNATGINQVPELFENTR